MINIVPLKPLRLHLSWISQAFIGLAAVRFWRGVASCFKLEHRLFALFWGCGYEVNHMTHDLHAFKIGKLKKSWEKGKLSKFACVVPRGCYVILLWTTALSQGFSKAQKLVISWIDWAMPVLDEVDALSEWGPLQTGFPIGQTYSAHKCLRYSMGGEAASIEKPCGP